MLDDYTRAHVNRAIEDALRPRGMSIHNGKVSIDAATLQRLVTMIDRGTEACLNAQARIAELEQDDEALEVLRRLVEAIDERVSLAGRPGWAAAHDHYSSVMMSARALLAKRGAA